MNSVSEAKNLLREHCKKGRISEVNLSGSLNLVLAEDVHSPMHVPSFDNSAMDGYAMKFDRESKSWNIAGVVQAGDTSKIKVASQSAVRILTGAKMPEGADTVIQQELVRVDKEKKRVFYEGHDIKNGSNVRLKGSQCQKGDKILSKGTRIGPGTVGLLASVGISSIRCYLPPSVAYIITGNELREVGEELLEGEIYNSNGPMLEALLIQRGIQKISALRAADDKKKLQQSIDKALANNDVLLLSGGISVGDFDYVKECLEEAGVKELFYKVKQRPGKPLFAGKKGEKWIFALPGNPASVLSCFIQYVKPVLRSIMGETDVWQPDLVLPLNEDMRKKPGFTFFMKARKEQGKVALLAGQQSFNLQAFNAADCLVELAEEFDFIEEGTSVNVYDL